MKRATPDAAERALLKRARQAAKNSYAPYSRFPVGAAVMAQDRRVFAGCNVENASYGLTLCAERAAVLAAVSAGVRRLRAVAITGGRGRAARPCGACLQVLAEFAGPDLKILLAPLDKPGLIESLTLAECLPESFALPKRAGRR